MVRLPARPQRRAIRLAWRTIRLNEEIIRTTQETIGDEDVGVENFGMEGSIRRLAFIFENLPVGESVPVQAAYILRAIMCAQIFNDGNKRTATVLALAVIGTGGARVESTEDEIYDFIVRRFGGCPRWPMEENDILARDRLFNEIAPWLETKVRSL